MTPYRAEMVVAAGKYRLDPDLVQAICEQESTYRPNAWNPEPRFRWFWDVRRNKPFRPITPIEALSKFPPKDFPAPVGVDADAEYWGQQASWGLMQVMGAVARQMGFKGAFLTETLNPTINLDLGGDYFQLLLHQMTARAAPGIGDRVVLASTLADWNGGPSGNLPDLIQDRNRDYASDVLKRYDRIRTEAR